MYIGAATGGPICHAKVIPKIGIPTFCMTASPLTSSQISAASLDCCKPKEDLVMHKFLQELAVQLYA